MAMWRRRMNVHADASYVHLIVNEGPDAGASLEHSHAQLYALRFVPTAIARERMNRQGLHFHTAHMAMALVAGGDWPGAEQQLATMRERARTSASNSVSTPSAR